MGEGVDILKYLLKTIRLLSLLTCILISLVLGAENMNKPVNPNASPEAKALLQLLYDISGKYTLTGQHNYPKVRDRNTQFAGQYIGKTPIVFSTDWGFSADDKDSFRARPDIVEEIKKQHKRGSIITICWHAVPPTANEPITFSPLSDKIPPDSLISVQGQLLDQQFQDVLTPGTKLYRQWCAQVDTIAGYLKKLEDVHIPILWRPYHEMNGNWFWWGGRRGKNGTAALYRQLFDRYVNYHKLSNLIWMWSVDRPVKSEMKFENFFPGDQYVDVLTLDVYGNDFAQSYYNQLLLLAKEKPIALAEVVNPPSPEVLITQPKWTFYVTWSGMVRNTSRKQYRELMSSQRVQNLEDSLYWNILTPFREICRLPSTPIIEDQSHILKYLSGEWMINEERTETKNRGIADLPYKIWIAQKDHKLVIHKMFIVEYEDDRIIVDTLALDGSETKSEMWHMPMSNRTALSAQGDTMYVHSKNLLTTDRHNSEVTIDETWCIHEKGSILCIIQYANTFWGSSSASMIFEKK